jgi:hypothetical protein
MRLTRRAMRIAFCGATAQAARRITCAVPRLSRAPPQPQPPPVRVLPSLLGVTALDAGSRRLNAQLSPQVQRWVAPVLQFGTSDHKPVVACHHLRLPHNITTPGYSTAHYLRLVVTNLHADRLPCAHCACRSACHNPARRDQPEAWRSRRPMDSNGLADPYVRFSCAELALGRTLEESAAGGCGATLADLPATAICKKTLNPRWLNAQARPRWASPTPRPSIEYLSAYGHTPPRNRLFRWGALSPHDAATGPLDAGAFRTAAVSPRNAASPPSPARVGPRSRQRRW